jgi:two-component system sensor histidine kinase KdpD
VLFDSVSHELKTPLSILSAAIDHIGDAVEKGDAEKALSTRNESVTAIRRLQRSVDNLLGMTRMESGHGTKEYVLCDLEEIIIAAREQASDVLSWHTLTISVPDDLPAIQADPVLFRHAIANLLTNAAQYTPPGGEIRARVFPRRRRRINSSRNFIAAATRSPAERALAYRLCGGLWSSSADRRLPKTTGTEGAQRSP